MIDDIVVAEHLLSVCSLSFKPRDCPQREDVFAPLNNGCAARRVVGGQSVDANWLLAELDERGATAVIPPKSNWKVQRDYDEEAYKWRHLVENYFAKIKEFRGIATRYDKTDSSYAADWNLAAALIASR